MRLFLRKTFTEVHPNKNLLTLVFMFPSATYTVVEEYYTYTWDAFVADVGGYLVS